MSAAEGKDWTRARVAEIAADGPVSVLDVGPGVGTYAKLLRDLPVSRIVGLEVWEPYVSTYRLDEYYDEIVIGDVRTTDLPEVDVVVLGDVLEHMTRAEAREVWERAAAAARRAVITSLPIVHYPQHEIEGNPFEVHVEEDWDHEQVLATLPGIDEHWTGDVVGVYLRRTDATAHRGVA